MYGNDYESPEQRRAWVQFCEKNNVVTSTAYREIRAAFLAGWVLAYEQAAVDYY